MATQTTRRALLGGAGLAAAVAIVPAVAAVGSAGPLASPELTALIAAAERAGVETARHHTEVVEPAMAYARDAIAALPHTTLDAGESFSGGRVIWSTSKPSTVAIARSIVDMAKEGKDMEGAGLQYARTLTAAQRLRERAIARIHRDCGLDAECERNDAMNNALAELQNEVAAFPVSTAIDLRAKLSFMVKNQMGDGIDWLDGLLTDADRIAGVKA